jgi:hypothetical protein
VASSDGFVPTVFDVERGGEIARDRRQLNTTTTPALLLTGKDVIADSTSASV